MPTNWDGHEHDFRDIRGLRSLDGRVDELRGRLDDLDRLGALVDGLRHDQGELISLVDELRGQVRELETDRAAMLRRMRQMEDALSIHPASADLTTADPAPFPTTGAWVNDRPPVQLDELDEPYGDGLQ